MPGTYRGAPSGVASRGVSAFARLSAVWGHTAIPPPPSPSSLCACCLSQVPFGSGGMAHPCVSFFILLYCLVRLLPPSPPPPPPALPPSPTPLPVSPLSPLQSELTGYAACIDRQASEEYMFERCRPEQAALAGCRSTAARVPAAGAAAAPVVAAASAEEPK